MIMIGSRGLGRIKGMLLGSVSSKVCHVAHCTCVRVEWGARPDFDGLTNISTEAPIPGNFNSG